MSISIQFFGAAGEVTGSCHLVTVGKQRLLLDCGLIQGGHKDETRNREPFPFEPGSIDAVVLSHAHIDHSGRLPLLIKRGFRGPVYTHRACRDLCRVMLKDAGFLAEKDAEWENRKRERKGMDRIEPLFTVEDAKLALRHFKGLVYGKKQRILPGVTLRLSDAGHILGSSIVELWLVEGKSTRKLVFSGDLGRYDMPVLEDPAIIRQAGHVVMESTYGDRLHRSWEDSLQEFHGVLNNATSGKGNILIPAFAVGRTQEILYLMAKNFEAWNLDRWHIFLDSPMAIEATRIFTQNADLFDTEATDLWRKNNKQPLLPNLQISRTPGQSMAINNIRRGAIIIAGSGMCTGGRIRHHLKHNIWRRECHLVITGFQARGTTGRALVDGARYIRLWGEQVRVAARVHTIGGLSAHADQLALKNWYGNFRGHPPVTLVHGEERAITGLSDCLRKEFSAPVHVAKPGERLDLL
ncbi:MAG: MBL fold metallo-hydrolase [Xanthomonadales bacterium]|nr:MBL fold metallo-hydrolase [Xanthomonadales bacterium]